MKTHKFALVLSGGGFKSAFQLGALEYLKDHWTELTGQEGPMNFDVIAGVSGGCLNAVMLAMDKFEQLQHLWETVSQEGSEVIYTSDFLNSSGKVNIQDLDRAVGKLFHGFSPSIPLGKALSALFTRKGKQRLFRKVAADAVGHLAQQLNQGRF